MRYGHLITWFVLQVLIYRISAGESLCLAGESLCLAGESLCLAGESLCLTKVDNSK